MDQSPPGSYVETGRDHYTSKERQDVLTRSTRVPERHTKGGVSSAPVWSSGTWGVSPVRTPGDHPRTPVGLRRGPDGDGVVSRGLVLVLERSSRSLRGRSEVRDWYKGSFDRPYRVPALYDETTIGTHRSDSGPKSPSP